MPAAVDPVQEIEKMNKPSQALLDRWNTVDLRMHDAIARLYSVFLCALHVIDQLVAERDDARKQLVGAVDAHREALEIAEHAERECDDARKFNARYQASADFAWGLVRSRSEQLADAKSARDRAIEAPVLVGTAYDAEKKQHIKTANELHRVVCERDQLLIDSKKIGERGKIAAAKREAYGVGSIVTWDAAQHALSAGFHIRRGHAVYRQGRYTGRAFFRNITSVIWHPCTPEFGFFYGDYRVVK